MPHKLKFNTSNFTLPHSLKEALQRFSLELNCVMVWLRNEAQHHDTMDFKVLEAAFLISQLLDDAHQEAEQLIPQIERRVSGADLA